MNTERYWLLYAKASFLIALIVTIISIYLMPGDLLIKGYYTVCSLLLITTTITLSKSLRDDSEFKKMQHKIK